MKNTEKICRMCGSLLIQKLMIGTEEDGEKVWYCKGCNQIEQGTYAEIFNLAEEYVDIAQFNYFPDLDENGYAQGMNVAKVCQILGQFYVDAGLLREDGFDTDVVFDYEKLLCK